MLLQVLLLVNQPLYMFHIAAHQIIFPFHPGQQVGVVGEPNGLGGICVVIKGHVNVIQIGHAGEIVLCCVPVEKGHEAGIPNPNDIVIAHLVHIRAVRYAGILHNVVVSHFPSLPIQLDVTGVLVKNRRGDFCGVKGFCFRGEGSTRQERKSETDGGCRGAQPFHPCCHL